MIYGTEAWLAGGLHSLVSTLLVCHPLIGWFFHYELMASPNLPQSREANTTRLRDKSDNPEQLQCDSHSSPWQQRSL